MGNDMINNWVHPEIENLRNALIETQDKMLDCMIDQLTLVLDSIGDILIKNYVDIDRDTLGSLLHNKTTSEGDWIITELATSLAYRNNVMLEMKNMNCESEIIANLLIQSTGSEMAAVEAIVAAGRSRWLASPSAKEYYYDPLESHR